MNPLSLVSSTVLAALAQLVEEHSGLFFSESRLAELAGKAQRVFAGSGCRTWEAFLSRLADLGGESLLQQLIEALTIGETYFFRHRAYFDRLEREVLPALIGQRKATRQLRIWCAGCATGEEAYSLAILVRRCLPDIEDWRVSILASDVNHQFLARAEKGVYGSWSFRETDASFQDAYFTREGTRYRVRPELRRHIQFKHINLVEDASAAADRSATPFDLILCRNVLIYFAPSTSERVVAHLRSNLSTNGWLVLGPSDWLAESMVGLKAHFDLDALLYQRVEVEKASSGVAVQPLAARVAEVQPLAAGLTTDGIDYLDGKVPLADLVPTPALVSGPVASPTIKLASALDAVDSQTIADTGWGEAWRAAYASANRGDVNDAETHCRRAIRAAAFRPEPYYLLGMLCQGRGDGTAAMAAFRQALYTDRGFVPAHLAVAAIQRQSGQLDQARNTLARAQRLLADRPADDVLLAEEGLTVGRLRDAVAQALIATTPRSTR